MADSSEGAEQGATLLDLADELYALPLADFTLARDARAKELKKPDPGLSQRVKALRKPATAAWVVNLLVRREGAQVQQVLDVGQALREAQASMSGDELRALTRQRRQLTAAVTTRARAVAAGLGLKITQAVADQVEATLTAAMIDEHCAEAVRSGLLVAPLASTGVAGPDPEELTQAVAAPEALGFAATPREGDPEVAGRPDLRVVPDPEADQKALTAARDELEEAEAGVGEARSAYDASVAEVEQLEARSMQVQAEIDELRRRVAELETSLEEVEDELGDAEDARGEAEAGLAEASASRDAAAAAVERLSPRG